MIGVTILGSNSAIPAFGRHPASQVVCIDHLRFMIDCGEGTQIQMINYKIRRSKISHIFISHLHGDHYFGLIGLINSFALLGRTQDLTIVAPPELKEIIDLQLKVADTTLSYPLHFHPILHEGFLFHIEHVAVSCFKTDHRIPCYGFRFDEIKKPRKIIADKLAEHQIPFSAIDSLRDGADYITENGNVIPNTALTIEAPKGHSYAYCADTRYFEDIIPSIQGADMIFHETTYLKNNTDRAIERYHSTTFHAATIAKRAEVKRLLIGHFSSKYETLDGFLEEAREVFPNTDIAIEGASFFTT